MERDKTRIEVGDSVKVFLPGENDNVICGLVDHIPCATGDSWILLEKQAGIPVYIQSFSYMILMEKAK